MLDKVRLIDYTKYINKKHGYIVQPLLDMFRVIWNTL
jgi:uncharacterized C2H2 Zn-finger protein